MIDPQKIWTSPQLPSLPSVAIRLLEISRDPDVGIRDVIEVVKTDPAISAKILKSTNSSFFGISSEITSIDRAVPLLGTTMVTSLALSFSLSESTMRSGPLSDHFHSYWTRSAIQAVAASLLGESLKKESDCDYFMAGLLMDLGCLAMLEAIPGEYLPVLNVAKDQERNLYEVETEVLGFNHIEIGMKLMENWKLPNVLHEGVRYHHASPEQLAERASDPQYNLLITMATTSSIGDYFCAANKWDALKRLRELTSEYFSLTELDLQDLLANVQTRLTDLETVFSIDTTALSNPIELLTRANEQLVQLALQEHVATAQAEARQEAVERKIRELKTKHEELQEQSLHDPLTRTYNRQFFEESLKREISNCARCATTIGLIFCDIDRFKDLNDTYGHQFGDQVLKTVVGSFRETLREPDILARYGGEEFIILLSQPTEKGIKRVAERIREGVESQEIQLDGKCIPVTVSVGAVITIPGRSEPDLMKRLIAEADEAMYEAKRSGRNQVSVKSLLTEIERELLWESTRLRFSRWLADRKILDIPSVSKAILQCEVPHLSLGDLARKHGLLTEAQINQILEDQERTGERFGETGIRLGILTAEFVSELLALQREDPYALAKTLVDLEYLEKDEVDALLLEYMSDLKVEFANSAAPEKPPTVKPV